LEADDVNEALLNLLASPTIASKRWAYRRYDHMVQTGTVIRPGDGDAAVLRVRGRPGESDRYFAVCSDGNHRYVARDPLLGGQLAVCESARNLVCVGAEPAGLTNCLNFGSPERPRVFGSFRRCVEGMAAACRALNVPVTGGNVSFYNEHDTIPIPPTPMIGMIGLIENAEHITRPGFRAKDDVVCILGPTPGGLGGSEFLKQFVGPDQPGETPLGLLPEFSLDHEVRLQTLMLRAIRGALIESAHDVSDGGVAVAISECCLLSPEDLGAEIDALPGEDLATSLFGELPPRVVVTVRPDNLQRLQELAALVQVDCVEVGHVIEGGLGLLGSDTLDLQTMRRAFETRPFGGLV
jgi:phosphoribosylformylglycinamidine synthase